MNQITKLLPGHMLGDRYAIISLLGQGGMGSVYLAEDLKLKGKLWAIKQTYHQQDDYQIFVEEAEILTQLSHPNIPNIIDYYPPDSDRCSYLIMDYIKGKTLSDIFDESNRTIDYKSLIKYAVQICELFDYLHNLKPSPVIYRDLKPSNIMIDEQDNVRLIDFGIARNYKIGNLADTVQIGTIGFAAPEQYESQQTDSRTDLYNLGAVMYYLLSGGQYYYTYNNTSTEVIQRGLPDDLYSIIYKLLAVDPINRFVNANEVKQRLIHIEEEDLHNSSVHHNASKEMVLRKIIVIGGMYSGVGSTFAALSIARILNDYNIPHAVIEYPNNQPELYSLIDGDRKKPVDYIYIRDEIEDNTKGKEWSDGHTYWFPINPNKTYPVWTNEHVYKLLLSVKQPIILIDISDNWNDPSIEKLFNEADEIIMIADAFPSKFNLPSSSNNISIFMDLMNAGKSVRMIGNRDIKKQGRVDWVRSFPIEPSGFIPNIPYEETIQMYWKGKIPQDKSEIREKLFQDLLPLLRSIFPKNYFNNSNTKSTNILKRIFS